MFSLIDRSDAQEGCDEGVCVQGTVSFFDEAAVRIDAGAVVLLLGLLLTQPEDVF